MKTAFLLNPRAKKGTGIYRWYANSSEIKRLFPEHESFAPADAHELRKTLATLAEQRYHKLIIVGGDGTVNRVLNVLLGEFPDFAKEVLLGVLPMGTGNDLARSAGFTRSIQKNLEILQRGHSTKIDVGKVTYTTHTKKQHTGYFINMLTVGVSTLAVEAMSEATSPSPFSYLGVLVKKLTHYTPPAIRMYAQEKLVYSGPILIICIANGRYAGGGIPLLPTAALHDGKFHSLIIKTMPIWKQLLLLPFLRIGQQPFRERILCITNQVRIEAELPQVAFEVDGELPGCLPLEITCIHQAIHLIQNLP